MASKAARFGPNLHIFRAQQLLRRRGESVRHTLWSTGRIEAPVSRQYYSQIFTLRAGTYYLADIDYSNLSSFRDASIVVTPTPAARSLRRLLSSICTKSKVDTLKLAWLVKGEANRAGLSERLAR